MIGSSPENKPKLGRPFGKRPAQRDPKKKEAIELDKIRDEAKARAGSLKDDLSKKQAIGKPFPASFDGEDDEGLFRPPTLAKDKMIDNPAQPWDLAQPSDELSKIQPVEGTRLAPEQTISPAEYDRLARQAQLAAQNPEIPAVDLPGLRAQQPEAISADDYERMRRQALQPNPIARVELPQINPKPTPTLSQTKKVILGLVSYKDVSPVTAIALLSTVQRMGDKVGIEWHFGDAIIENARNHVADLFMKREGAEWLLFIDDDVVPPFGRPDVTKRLCRLPDSYVERDCFWVDELLNANKTLVGGMYFGRSVEGRPMYAEACFQSSLTENQIARNTNVINCKPTDWVATGCMLIHRSVFEAIQTHFPELAPSQKVYTTSLGTQVVYETKMWGYFNKIDPSQGEDVSFCHRAQMVGHQPHIHLGVRCQHIGMQAWNYANVKGGMSETPTVQPANGGLLRKVA